MYEFARGPMVWLGFVVFFAGLIFRTVVMYRQGKKDKIVHPYISFKFGARSLGRWLIPYSTTNMRMRPAFTAVSFLFHLCLLITPLLVLGHAMSFEESWGISWWTLSDSLVNVMTFVVVIGGVVFALRRIADPTVRYISTWRDYAILAVVLAPYVTGILAYYQVGGYETIITLHILSGVLWLVVIPFTRLVHMLFFPFTRAYMGSEFGFVRNSKDW